MTYRNLVIKGGVRVVWESIHDVTFVDCDFEDAEIHLVVQSRDNGSAASRNWTFVRCTFMGATRRDWGHSHGAYLQGVDDFTFRDCLFKYNGWLNGQRFNQNHHVYLVDVGNVRFLRCSFRRAAAQGIKALGFERLVVRDCEFRGNLIDIAGDDRSRGGIVAIKDSSFYNTGGYDSSNLALGWSVHFEYDQHELDRVVVRDCTWVGPGVPNNTVAIKLAGRIHRARIIRPDLRRWAAEADDQAKIKNQIGNRLSIIKGLGLN